MLSNSKLDAVQKADRKDMLKALPDGSRIASAGVLTILCIPRGLVTEVFSSVMSQDEKKFRAKVGEYHALCRYFDGHSGMLLPGVWDADTLVEIIG